MVDLPSQGHWTSGGASRIELIPMKPHNSSPEKITPDKELRDLREINSRSWPGRLAGYASRSGPGWIQGALTLGASSATSAFYLGWKFGYEMLWVNVLGMLMGVIMFGAIARPTLFKKESIYRAMGRHVSPTLALTWALAAIVGSIFWSMNQYSVATACLGDLAVVAGWAETSTSEQTIKWILGLVILGVSIPLTWAYGKPTSAGVQRYEKSLRIIVAIMLLCFLIVALRTGVDWGRVLRGLVPSGLPDDPADRTMVLGALGCAVGINMTFLFPLTLQARSWGREHLGLTRFDLWGGMLLPFAVGSSLVVITTANILQGSPEAPANPAAVASVMSPLFEGTLVPASTGRVLFDIGVAAMPLSTIPILMLITGLAVAEVMHVPRTSRWFKIGALLPAIGILGVGYKAPFWLGPLISSFGLILLPIAYLGFLLLTNNKNFMGDDREKGNSRIAWNIAMTIACLIAIIGAFVKVKDTVGALVQGLN